MAGKRISRAAGVFLLLAWSAGTATLRAQEEGSRNRILPSIAAEYFARTIAWDEKLGESRITAVLAMPRGEFRLESGFEVGVFVGFGMTNPNGLVFRGLPFSIDYEAGSTGAFLAGADVRKVLFETGDFEAGVMARAMLSLASTSTLEISSLNEAGTAEIRTSWQRVSAGPFVRYLGYENFSPYLSVAFDKIWGRSTMSENIGELEGEETKKISSKGLLGITLGVDFEPARGFRLTGEVSAVPYTKLAGGLDADYAVALRVVFGI